MKEKYGDIERGSVDSPDVPSCAITIVRFFEDVLECFVLGDCTIVIDHLGKRQVLTDHRVSKFDKRAIRELNRIQVQEGIRFDQARRKVLPLLRKHRRLKNKQEGYWILEFDKRAIDFGRTTALHVQGPTSLLLMSDGFSELSDTFKVSDNVGELLPLTKRRGLANMYSRLRQLANADGECLQFPRLRKLDDASAILIDLEPDTHRRARNAQTQTVANE